jgi:arylsulfatase A-like enzyme
MNQPLATLLALIAPPILIMAWIFIINRREVARIIRLQRERRRREAEVDQRRGSCYAVSTQPEQHTMTNEEFLQRETALLDRLPAELRQAVSYMAYERGHAYGHEEVLGHVSDLVENLSGPIDALIARVRQEAA